MKPRRSRMTFTNTESFTKHPAVSVAVREYQVSPVWAYISGNVPEVPVGFKRPQEMGYPFCSYPVQLQGLGIDAVNVIAA